MVVSSPGYAARATTPFISAMRAFNIRAVADEASPIVLTERRDHVEYLAERLQGFVRHVVVLQGGMTRRQRQDLGTRLAEVPDREERLVLATGRSIGEGFDDARLDVLFLCMPISWKGTWCSMPGACTVCIREKKEVRRSPLRQAWVRTSAPTHAECETTTVRSVVEGSSRSPEISSPVGFLVRIIRPPPEHPPALETRARATSGARAAAPAQPRRPRPRDSRGRRPARASPHALDVLAGMKPVGLEVRTGASARPRFVPAAAADRGAGHAPGRRAETRHQCQAQKRRDCVGTLRPRHLASHGIRDAALLTSGNSHEGPDMVTRR